MHALDDGADLGVEVGDRVAVNIVTYGAPYEGNPFGVRCYGYSFGLDEREGLWGGYGEYMSILPGTQLVRLSDDISAEELTLFEPLSNMVAWLAKVNLQAGQTIVIQGPGHMGLTCAAYAKSLGATVVVTGTDEDALRLEVARGVGADHAIDATVDDPVEVVQDLTGGFGASVAVDLASAPSTPSLCFDLVHHLGQVVWAGLKDRAAVPVVTDKVVMKSLTIHGGAGGTPESVAEACRILNQGDFPTGPLLGEVVGLDEIDRAMEILLRTAEPDDRPGGTQACFGGCLGGILRELGAGTREPRSGVGEDEAAGDGAGEVRGEEHHEAAHFVVLGHAPEGRGRHDGVDVALGERPGDGLREGGAGGDRHHPDAERPPLDCGGVGDVVDGGLGGAVARQPRRRPRGLAGTDIDDHPSGVLTLHHPRLGTHGEGGEHQVLVQDVAPCLTVEVQQGRTAPRAQHPDVVDGHVEAAQSFGRLRHHALELGVVACVGDDAERLAGGLVNDQ